jgi:glyoxylase-like metal-dependent hydrolase (beta-lactamase superfamily II)
MPTVHTHRTGPAGALVNAYLVETPEGVVAVDATLTVSDARALRARAEQLGKPVLAVLLTHSHPDHYGGLTDLVAGDDVPIFATAGVSEVIRRDDPVKEQILRPMFGDAWAAVRTFPNRTVADGETLDFAGVTFTALDLGPGESPHDSPWLLGDDRTVFLGDQVYDRMHAYLADGHHETWLAHIARLERELPPDAVLHIGHGGPVDRGMFAWQRGYIETFVDAVDGADWSAPDAAHAAVVARVKRYLPTDALQFLMELSIAPIAVALGRLDAAEPAPAP